MADDRVKASLLSVIGHRSSIILVGSTGAGFETMPDQQARTSRRIEPEAAWTVVTEAPLKGLTLAREAGTILAWDETDQLYQLDLNGEYLSVARAPGKIVAAAASDDGSRIALLGDGARLWLLDADLGVIADRQGPPDPISLAIDPHGRYVVIATRMGLNSFYTRHARPAGKFETQQPLAFLTFLGSRPILAAAAAYGMIMALELSGSPGRLEVDPLWIDRQIAGVGRLAATGDGSIILASCFTHGVQRYDLHGQNSGAYHLGGTPTHAVPDFAGRVLAVATAEGELAILSPAGNVRWKSGLPRPAIALETDPLGRYIIYGQATGEVVRLDLDPSERPAKAPRQAQKITPAGAPPLATAKVPVGVGSMVRKPDWTLPVAASDDQAETAVVAVLDDPPRVAFLSSSLKMQVITADGRNLGFAPEVLGVGRILRTAPGWIAAATDKHVVLFNARKDSAQRLDLSLVEITHLLVRPDTYGLLIVQERDRIGRATIAGRWVWKMELKSPVEDVAIGPEGDSAFTDDSGALNVLDAGGQAVGGFRADPAEPLCLIEAVEGAPAGVTWMTLARRAEVLRGHDRLGRVLWESPVPWEGWQLHGVGPLALITAPDGRVLAYDGSGHLRGQGKATDGTRDLFGINEAGEPRRVSGQGVHLICADLDGRVRWRSVCDEPIGPIAVGRAGVAVIIGRSLAWFGHLD